MKKLLSHITKYIQWFSKYSLTVFFCASIIPLGVVLIAYSFSNSSNPTTIKDNSITTENLNVLKDLTTKNLSVTGEVSGIPISESLGSYSAIVYKEGNKIFAKKRDGSLIAEGVAGRNDARVINRAITYVNGQLSNGFERGIIFGNGLTYNLDDTIILKTGVILKDFYFYLKDGINKDVIKTENFDSLTGTDTPCSNHSVPHSFGLIDVCIRGNRDNNSSGSGVKIYGYGFVLDRVSVKMCPEHGLWIEGGANWGDGYSIPAENWIGSVFTSYNGKCGIVHKGPNDTVYNYIITHGNGRTTGAGTPGSTPAHGMYITGKRGVCDIKYIHSYGNNGDGVHVDGGHINAVYIETESNQGKGLVLKGHWFHTVDHLFAYDNRDVALYVTGLQYGSINFALIKNNRGSGNTVYIKASKFFSNIICYNNSGTDLCNFNQLNFSKINLVLLGNKNTGKAVVLGTTGNKISSNIIDIQASLTNTNGRLMEIHSNGRNIIKVRGSTYNATKDWDDSTYPPHPTDTIDYKTNNKTYTMP